MHHVEGWLNAPQRNTPEFDAQVKTVCDVYEAAPQWHAQGIHLMSTDEKTGYPGARTRCADQTRPARRGRYKQDVARGTEYEYLRHGTQMPDRQSAKCRPAINCSAPSATRAPKWISSTTSRKRWRPMRKRNGFSSPTKSIARTESAGLVPVRRPTNRRGARPGQKQRRAAYPALDGDAGGVPKRP